MVKVNGIYALQEDAAVSTVAGLTRSEQDAADLRHDPRLMVAKPEASSKAAYFRALAGNVEAWMLQHSKKALMVTSALPEEGKSLVAINLAAALADADRQTMLLDYGSGTSPARHMPALRIRNGRIGRNLDDDAQTTMIPGLTLISTDWAQNDEQSGLDIALVRRWVETCRTNSSVRFMIVDAPAILANADAIALSRVVDAVLFVVAAERTPKRLVTQALQSVNEVPIVGVVMNRFRLGYSAQRSLRAANLKTKVQSR